MSIQAIEVPENALLYGHVEQGEYADAFATEISQDIKLADFIRAFYSSPVMRTERLILALIGRSSSTQQVEQLANAEITAFAAWRVAERQERQILLPDFRDQTCSWLMVESLDAGATRLYFGSGVHRKRQDRVGAEGLGKHFQLLLRFHLLYSRLLLWAAKRQLEKSAG